MATPRITGFLIAIGVISFFAFLIGSVITVTSNSYGLDYDNSTLTSLDKMGELNDNVEAIKSNATELKIESNNLFDKLSAFAAAGTGTLKLALGSYGLFDAMLNDASQQVSLGSDSNIEGDKLISNLRTIMGIIVIVLLFLGVFIAVILKMEL